MRSQSAGDRCHSRESTSTATPASGHQASGMARKTSPANSLGLKYGTGTRPRRSRVRRSPSATDRTPDATSASAWRNLADPRTGPRLSSAVSSGSVQRLRCTASATIARNVVGGGQGQRRVRYRTRRRRDPDAAGHPGSRWQAGRSPHPGKAGALHLPRGWDQHVNDVRDRMTDFVAPQRRDPGDHAAIARVEGGRDLPLGNARHPGVGEIDAGKQYPPRSAGPGSVPECAYRQAARQRLCTRNDVELIVQRLR